MNKLILEATKEDRIGYRWYQLLIKNDPKFVFTRNGQITKLTLTKVKELYEQARNEINEEDISKS